MRELNAIKAGNEDPFGMAGVKIGPFGTKENPRLIPSHFESRIVGCYSKCADVRPLVYVCVWETRVYVFDVSYI